MVPRVQAVVEILAEQRQRFARFCHSLADAELARPVPGSDWTVQDFISHVATLDGPYAGWFAALAGGAAPDLHRGSLDFDVDVFNRAAVAERRGRSVEALLAEAEQARAAVIVALARLTDAQLDTTIRFGGDRKRPPVYLPLAQFLVGWARHDAIHVADMLSALPERREAPELRAWLAQPALAASIRAYQQAMGEPQRQSPR